MPTRLDFDPVAEKNFPLLFLFVGQNRLAKLTSWRVANHAQHRARKIEVE